MPCFQCSASPLYFSTKQFYVISFKELFAVAVVSGVPLVPFSECKITDFFHSRQMFSQLFFKKKLREKDKALKDNALRPEKIFDFFRSTTRQRQETIRIWQKPATEFFGFYAEEHAFRGIQNIIKSISRPNSVCWSIKNERILTLWTTESLRFMQM